MAYMRSGWRKDEAHHPSLWAAGSLLPCLAVTEHCNQATFYLAIQGTDILGDK